ncbi:exosortase A [Sphingomonadaceae bacterium]|nr:exosortase A [Sphingomonadaceae bacterium]
MQPDNVRHYWQTQGLTASLPGHWRLPLARMALALVAILLLTARDWIAMADQWWNISTYNHVLFVGPIVGWLIWNRRAVLGKLTPTAWWPGLIALGGALLLWLLGSLAGVNTASQLGAVVALQAAVLALLGPRVGYTILFPLAYMLFLVPFGDELVPALQMITAKLVIWMTEFSGIDAHIEGVFIDTPAGLFEVAEACSGVKFLIAMLALGVLVAQVCFKSWKRRLLFLAAALTLPILANGVRAWGTIAIAQSQGIEFAAGFDHIFYGWVFFALVVVALLAGAWRWFDRDPEDSGVTLDQVEQSPLIALAERFDMRANAALGAILVLIVSFAAWFAASSNVEATLPEDISLPQVDGWQLTAYEPLVSWEPRASGADHRLLGRYRDEAGREVDVFIALYAAQSDDREASAPGQGALIPDSPWRWLASGPVQVDAASNYLFANGSVRRLTQTSYHTGNLLTGSTAKLKLANMRDRLLLRGKPTAMLILSSEQPVEQDAAETADAISAFRNDIGDEALWMDRIAGLR